jgi:hypothetical protein
MRIFALGIIALISLSGCGQPVAPQPLGVAKPGQAIVALEQLEIKGRAPMTGYSRDKFTHWIDDDKDGCDTRSEILERDAISGTAHRNSRGCVDGADINDPYSGTVITEVPGAGSEVDIDHAVALGNAWQTGAQSLTALQRQWLANDPTNLVAVDDNLNQQKRDSDAATWLPPNKASRCGYVARQISVKLRYNLWVTQPERDAMANILATCPQQQLIP